MQPHTVYLFSQGGKKTGFGHISRLIPIYDEFVKNNIFVRFIISGDISVERILGKRNYNIISWRNLKFEKIRKNDVVIIDTINLPYDFIFKTNYFTKNIYFISDRFLKKKIKARTKVINWRVGSVSDKSINEGLYGEKFAPLRNEIFKYRKEKFQYAIPKVVLSMGSGDILNLISHVLEIYKKEYLEKFDLQVIMQSHHKNFDNILKQYGKDAKLLVDIQPREIFEVISSSQFAIASGGHSIYEYSYIGTPVIHVLTAKISILLLRGMIRVLLIL